MRRPNLSPLSPGVVFKRFEAAAPIRNVAAVDWYGSLKVDLKLLRY